jgi:hypothetical protein
MASRPDPFVEEYVFGPIIGAYDVDEIIYEMLYKWQLSYLQEVARRAGEEPDELKEIRSWRVSHELEKMPEDQTPGVIIVNEGLIDEPLKRGSFRPGKSYWAVYRYRVGCLMSAKGKKNKAAPRANKLAKMYAEAMKLILIQKRDDKQVLGMIDWIDEGPGPLESEDDRTFAMWQIAVNVEVPNSAAWAVGPDVPVPVGPGDPDPPLLGTVESVEVDITKVPTDEEVG